MTEQPAQLREGYIWCKYHCASCDECFRSLAAFDTHRQGSYSKNTRKCMDPETLIRKSTGELALEALDGRCRIGNERGVFESTVWRVMGAAEQE